MLELPIERLLTTNRPDVPFCLCWANENWTRRWDGQDNEVLMAQYHSYEDDEGVIQDLIRFMRHPNYIRVNGRPLLLVYRVALFPDFARTAEHWRATCRRVGLGEIYLAFVESFDMNAQPSTLRGTVVMQRWSSHLTAWAIQAVGRPDPEPGVPRCRERLSEVPCVLQRRQPRTSASEA